MKNGCERIIYQKGACKKQDKKLFAMGISQDFVVFRGGKLEESKFTLASLFQLIQTVRDTTLK